MTVTVQRRQVLRMRTAHQQLDRPTAAERLVTDAAVLGLGVQDTGPDGGLWALAQRGVPVESSTATDDLALVRSARGPRTSTVVRTFRRWRSPSARSRSGTPPSGSSTLRVP